MKRGARLLETGTAYDWQDSRDSEGWGDTVSSGVQSQARKLLLTSVAVVFTLALIACDPGFRYVPDQWRQVDRSRWANTFGELEIQTVGVDALISTRSISPPFTFNNRGAEPVYLEGAQLLAGDLRRELVLVESRNETVVVEPGDVRRVHLDCDLEDYAVDVLGERFEIILFLSIGRNEEKLTIVFVEDM